MKATVQMWRTVFEDYGDPLWKTDVDNLRVQFRDNPRAGKSCTIRSRLYDDQGRYATDGEHDGASSFEIEFAVLDVTILAENWIEAIGVVTEVRSWDPPFIPALGMDKDGGPWFGAHECESCDGSAPGREPHQIVQHYLPPQCYLMKLPATPEKGADPQPIHVYGRYVRVTWGADPE